MKKKGSTAEYTAARDSELYANFLEILRTSDMPLGEMFGAAARRPCSRYFVSAERAAAVVVPMLRGACTGIAESVYEGRKRMYADIATKALELMEDNPDLLPTHAVEQVICQPAPEFYLSDWAARQIIYRHRRRLKIAKSLSAKIIKE